ncbi:ABC transporter ATP-binding protein [Halanaerobium salsuginis]|jgi:ABC-type multidrug transport system ATPase subunit|uniref:ABC-2 type transport system ATP-binding protein n=1 Tax=Halanaerobium salsuginis TaxID=29563 RepID=A0A1I4J386_9FIRM|nr:ABC transporter ATP-binding protein [Halanaerobium salsuginis]SFL61010.1 ABC-2 type transport system ATP-binding protein [Halanaerobium salsuginis]
MSEFSLATVNLKKSFAEQKVLKGISLQVKRGEIMGLLGPNGAGKTTLIKIIIGILNPTAGQVKLFGSKQGRNISEDIKAKIGVVFEESNLYERLNAYDNLKLFAGINGVSLKRVNNLLAEFKLETAAKRAVKTYSKGMKKRLMICRALLADPELLILDEATGGLDPISAEIIRNKVLELKKQGKSILISTHYLEEADRLCDRVAFISLGNLIAVDKPAVFKDSLHKNFLELSFAYPASNNFELSERLKSFLKPGEEYQLEDESFKLWLIIDQTVLKRAVKLNEEFKLLNINRIEADLQDVFKQVNL